MTPDEHRNRFARVLGAAVDDLKRFVNGNAPKRRDGRGGEFKVTLVLRHTSGDDATILFGDDDEATVIVALTALGGGAGRARYKLGKDGLRAATDADD